ARIEGGTVRPSSLAVLSLTTRLFDRQIGRFGSVEDLSNVRADLAIYSGDTGPVADQAAGGNEATPFIDCGYGMTGLSPLRLVHAGGIAPSTSALSRACLRPLFAACRRSWGRTRLHRLGGEKGQARQSATRESWFGSRLRVARRRRAG